MSAFFSIATYPSRWFAMPLAGLLFAGLAAQAQKPDPGPFTTPISPQYKYDLLAKSVKDECVNPQQGLDPTLQVPYTTPTRGRCPQGLVPKANQSRVWASAVSGNGLWMGTAPNYFAMGFGEMPLQMWGALPSLPSTRESVNSSKFLAEWENSQFYKTVAPTLYPAVDPGSGDWRPPRIYRYDLATRALVDKSPTSGTALDLINQTEGIRAGGAVNGVVFMAGLPIIGSRTGTAPQPAVPGVRMFAYSEATGELLAARTLPEYSNVRQMLTIGDNLYVAVFGPGGDQAPTGYILRWTPVAEQYLSFEVVGLMPPGAGAPGELIYSPVSQRIYVTTWAYTTPCISQMGVPQPCGAALLQSPVSHPPDVPFTAADTVQTVEGAEAPLYYEQLWRASEYSRDVAITMIVGGGALAAYDNYVYWGTMSAPATGPAAYWTFRMQTDPSAIPTATDVLEGNAKAQMPLTLWRIDVTTGARELLYGSEQVPVYDYLGAKAWSTAPTGWTPKWGQAGFGNPFNYYTWTMKVFDGKLWVGTSECSYPYVDVDSTMFQPAFPALGLTLAQLGQILLGARSGYLYGADLVRFDTSESPGVFESVSGLGNYLNVGFRTMATDGKALYLGTENYANINAQGGWEMIKLYNPRAR